MYHKNEYSKETKFYDQFDNGGYHDKQLGEWLGAWMLVLNGNDYQGFDREQRTNRGFSIFS